ncbi:MAG: hypothetical protein O2955_12635 [Planctomycetota bacterium]|nr:hypothetical protein [Planctomycetota bacterium]MDA1213357.1 hypothetical protein [Planctomycetota bacterium]
MSISRCALTILLVTFTVNSMFAANRTSGRTDQPNTLTKKHGPWMILVASIRPRIDEKNKDEAQYKKDAAKAYAAADALVAELRKKGIPAYKFVQKGEVEEVETLDRLGRQQLRHVNTQQERICVLAGNYESIDDRIAQDTLKWIKEDFEPKSLNGGNFQKTPGRPTPLSGAFLTMNPMLTPAEVRSKRRDPLLRELNNGAEFSLLENDGKYTVVVASFYGKSLTQMGAIDQRKADQVFRKVSRLDEAGLDAWKLAHILRDKRHIEAYVLHDRYQSVVTVGSFDSPDDPEIQKIMQVFGAKITIHPQNGNEILTAEVITNQEQDSKQGNILRTFVFDPKPQLIEIPRLK